jgi:branched-chain amino acid transport system permease protein
MNFFLQLLVSGIMLGGVYSLVALGFVIIYKSTGVINFAQGQLLAIGALIVWSFMVPLGLPLWAAGLLAVLCGASLGIVIERLTIRPMTGQPLMAVIVMTIALATFLDSAIPPVFGSDEEAFPPLLPTGGLHVWGLSISYEYLLCFISALALVGIFLYFFHFTRLGITMRAVSDGHDTARSCGVKVGTIFSTAWAIAAISAMAGGFLLGNIESISPAMSAIALRVFPVLILGGLDSIPGCIIAGPIVGTMEIMAVGYADPITEGGAGEVVPHLIILATLIFRPHGIFGQEHIERI